MKFPKKKRKHFLIIVFLILGISTLHYLTRQDLGFRHVFYRELYFLPIILASFWFGLRGGLAASLSATLLYLPFIVLTLDDFTAHEMGNFLTMALYNLVGGMLGWLRDREMNRQKELRKVESLAAMGKAVSSIAHDMKSPLVAIGGLTSQILRKVSPADSIHRKLSMILTQSQRLEYLVKDMLLFARPLELKREEGNLRDLVYEIVEFSSEIARQKDVKITISTEMYDFKITFDKNRLQQVLQNLLSNAIEASPAGEKVIVRLAEQDQAVVFEVIDNGSGISEEHLASIYEPFFSTKDTGTGLGLSIVKKIVDAHGGEIRLRGNQPCGTSFSVLIPK